MAKTTAEEARELSELFRDLAVQLGDYRFSNWGTLSSDERKNIEDTEWSLLNASSDFTTIAVGIDLANLDADIRKIERATNKARQAIRTANTVKNVLKVATAAISLAGAIISKNPQSILTAAKDLFETGKTVINAA
jgi:hypothetical protein